MDDSVYDGTMNHSQKPQQDLKGLNQLTHDGIIGVVDLVEAMHQRISTLGGILNQGDLNKTTGLTGFIYNTIRQTTALSIKGIDLALATFSPMVSKSKQSQTNETWRSILNGVLGDHLANTNNPLALTMTWHHQDQELTPVEVAELCNEQSGQPLLLIHGLCMNDRMWRREGHNHGVQLQQTNHMIPIYLRYNSGLAVYDNGLLLEHLFKQFFNALNPEKSCDVLCHSMGGLVLRSAMHVAQETSNEWYKRLGKAVFLGTPHQGAVLEKTGNVIDYLISINPYSAPFAKLGHKRSHGIKNLRHGTITADHQTIQLPKGVDCYAFAASTQDNAHQKHQQWIGDGLVSVDSALGGHKHPEREVLFKKSQKRVVENVSHMGLLSDPHVFRLLQEIYSD